MALTLHSMWRATAPYRVRIGLNLKGLAYDYVAHDLAGGEARRAPYIDLNRQGLVPALETDDGVMTQSLAILEWLEETQPEPPLLPAAPRDRATVRAMAEIVACDIHPLNNLRVLQALHRLGHPFGGAEQTAWIAGWMTAGFDALEPMIAAHGAGFCFRDTPGLADCCLIPQLYSAERFAVDLAPYPAIRAVGARAAEHPAFVAAHPNRQPDAAPA
ncbi:MAG TPA: maleylacetoacetate isomerase [Caulobacteraceae bacterium]|jgi:maleylacetoacetate isomerase/maleylpyruvate isomerase|nr:maleylacetoacetate isomerase [Caulobacteraceae bacterium]